MPLEEGLRKTKWLIYFIESHLLYIRNTVKRNLQQSVLARGVLNILGVGMKKYCLGYWLPRGTHLLIFGVVFFLWGRLNFFFVFISQSDQISQKVVLGFDKTHI